MFEKLIFVKFIKRDIRALLNFMETLNTCRATCPLFYYYCYSDTFFKHYKNDAESPAKSC